MTDQQFTNFDAWVVTAKYALTRHPDYADKQHDAKRGFVGYHFTAICFDQAGRLCRNGGDFQRARDENQFPVQWVWPDQVGPLMLENARLRVLLREAADDLSAWTDAGDCDYEYTSGHVGATRDIVTRINGALGK